MIPCRTIQPAATALLLALAAVLPTWGTVQPADRPIPLHEDRTVSAHQPAAEEHATRAIAIFEDERFGKLKGKPAAPSEPKTLAAWLHSAGCTTVTLRAEPLADPAVLNTKNFWLLVLPYGPYFPAEATETIRAFLKRGGCFFSTGGYAFDAPVRIVGGQPQVEPPPTPETQDAKPRFSLNTRFGKPGDVMMTRDDQIGVFDPGFVLRRVAAAVAAGDQFVVPSDFRRAGPFQGWAACSMIARNNPVFPKLYARTIPLIEGVDRFGRPRGPIGSIAYIHDGPFRGSAWAFFGVTNRDLFDPDDAAAADMRKLFARVVAALRRRLFLVSLTSELACYEPGESVVLRATVANYGAEAASVVLRFQIDGQRPIEQRSLIEANRTVTVECRPPLPKPDRDFQPFCVELQDPDGPIDRLRAAYCVRLPEQRAQRTRLELKDNYFRLDDRAVFLTGTNQTGAMFFAADEGPLTWHNDFAQAADAQLRIWRILHISCFAHQGYEGRGAHDAMHLARKPPKKLVRQMDAIVQLAHKHGLVPFLSLHDWLGVPLTDEQLASQRKWNEFWVRRYRDTGPVLYDIENEPWIQRVDQAHLRPAWEAFLAARHGSLAAAWRAWTMPGPAPARLPQPDADAGTSEPPRWDDIRMVDADRFRHAVLERWLAANAAGIRAGDPDALFTVGLLQTPGAADPHIAARHTRFSNGHFYGDVHALARQLKLIDRRAFGQSLSLGEFGSSVMHHRRIHGQDGAADEQSVRYFLNVGHYGLGLGASLLCNWCFKDLSGAVFPWGIRHVGQGRAVPKDVLLAYRNFGLLAARPEPRYEPPELALLLPDAVRFGPFAGQVLEAIYAAIDALLRLRVDFNVINTEDLCRAKLPAKALLWPVPYACDDAAFERVAGFVDASGFLYLSGSVAFDELRRPSRAHRAARLGLKTLTLAPPFPAGGCPSPPHAHAAPEPVRSGRVFYVPWPVELRRPDELAGLYRRFLAFAGIRRSPITPDDAVDSVLSIPTRRGAVLTIVRRSGGTKRFAGSLAGLTFALELEADAPAMLWIEQGQLLAASLYGALQIDKAEWIRTTNLAAVLAVGTDQASEARVPPARRQPPAAGIAAAPALLVVPFGPGRVEIRTAAIGPQAVLQIGDAHNARWRTLVTAALSAPDGRLVVRIDDDCPFDLHLLGRPESLPQAEANLNRWFRR